MESKSTELIKNINDQQVMDSRDVAKLVGKTHAHLVRDIDGYINDMGQNPKLDSDDFFIISSYKAGTGKNYRSYLLTKQGCEFVANKITGRKGTIFTATYVSLFNEYQAEHNAAIEGETISENLAFKQRELDYKMKWLSEMKVQNVNKNKEIRNDTAKIFLKLGDIAEHYQEGKMATDFRNEAIKEMMTLPMGGRREFTASEIGLKLGVTPLQIGKWANKLGIKRDPSLSYRNREGQWRYYMEALRIFEDNKLEIQEDYLED